MGQLHELTRTRWNEVIFGVRTRPTPTVSRRGRQHRQPAQILPGRLHPPLFITIPTAETGHRV